MFLVHCMAVFLVRTSPASSIAKPAAIHITRKPCSRKERLFRMNTVSGSTAADARPANPTVAKLVARASRLKVVYFFIVGFPRLS